MAYIYAQRHLNYNTTNTTIPFDKIVTNIGGGMDVNGIFTAPTAGTYMFTYSGFGSSGIQGRVFLKVNGKAIAGSYDGVNWGTYALQVVLSLNARDKVNMFLAQGSVGDTASADSYTHFTGIQLA